MRLLVLCTLLVGFLLVGIGVQATYIPSPIKSIQPITIPLNSTLSNTAIPNPTVIAANSILIYQGVSGDEVSPTNCSHEALGTITSGTLITATKGCVTSNTTYNAVLVEFLGTFVRSQGCNTIAVGDSSLTGTRAITSVVTAKTMVALTGMTNIWAGAGSSGGHFLPRLDLTSSILVTATRQVNPGGAPYSLVAGFCYIEFK